MLCFFSFAIKTIEVSHDFYDKIHYQILLFKNFFK